MANDLDAKATTSIKASKVEVWDALINPKTIKQYMFGTDVVSNWTEGSPIVWKGEWEGKPYEDKGVIVKMTPGQLLEYTHFSPLTGMPDAPENYHTVAIHLFDEKDHVIVHLVQDGNKDEKERDHSEKNWAVMLAGLKKLLEQTPGR